MTLGTVYPLGKTRLAPMPYQIVCLSCGYHRAWPTLVDAHADGHRHHAEHSAGRPSGQRVAMTRDSGERGDSPGGATTK